MPEQISLQAQDGSAIFADPLSEQRNDYVSSVLDVTLALQDMELRAITSLDNFGYGVALDLDGSQGEYGHRISNSDIRVLSQELRLVSATDAPLQWLLGVALSAEDFEEGREFNLRENTLVPLYRCTAASWRSTKIPNPLLCMPTLNTSLIHSGASIQTCVIPMKTRSIAMVICTSPWLRPYI